MSASADERLPAGGPAPSGRGYGAGARILSLGIASTGLVTFAYFAVASNVLGPVSYSRIGLLWSITFIVVTVIYRPVEQLLSRTIAQRRARGTTGAHPLRGAVSLQLGFAAGFLLVALLARDPLQEDAFDGSAALYWILVVAVVAYGVSYFARGWLAGHERFGLYGALVFLESASRFLFAVAVAVGLASGQTAVALGIAAAPFLSLLVIPWALSRRTRADPEADAGAAGTASAAGSFALAVFAVQLAEQTLLNAPVIAIDASSDDRALAGVVFNVLLIARAPLQLFQAVQTSLLPHLAGREATGSHDEFGRAIRLTVLASAAFGLAVASGLLAIGPWAMDALFGGDGDYMRVGLAAVGLGMGFHLIAGTLNQAALARGSAPLAAGTWLVCAALFVAWVAAPVGGDPSLERVEAGYLGTTVVLSGLLLALYRRDSASIAR